MDILKQLTMKNLSILTVVFFLTISCSEQPKPKNLEAKKLEIKYDSVLAKKIGADDYGMKVFVMAFLKKGPNRPKDSLKSAQLQRAHLNNIKRLANEGKLLVAGPFMDNGDNRGIYIFDVSTIEEAKKLTETDPAVKAGSLVMELHQWYGPAALFFIKENSKKVTKKKI